MSESHKDLVASLSPQQRQLYNLQMRLDKAEAANKRLREALELIAKGRWNVKKLESVTAIQFARLTLKALAETEDK